MIDSSSPSPNGRLAQHMYVLRKRLIVRSCFGSIVLLQAKIPFGSLSLSAFVAVLKKMNAHLWPMCPFVTIFLKVCRMTAVRMMIDDSTPSLNAW
jgi:hypothetical protein